MKKIKDILYKNRLLIAIVALAMITFVYISENLGNVALIIYLSYLFALPIGFIFGYTKKDTIDKKRITLELAIGGYLLFLHACAIILIARLYLGTI